MTSATDDYEDDKRMFAHLEQLTTRNAELEAEVARLKSLAQRMTETFDKGFTVSESCGPDNHYRLVSKFSSLSALHGADRAWLDICLEGRKS